MYFRHTEHVGDAWSATDGTCRVGMGRARRLRTLDFLLRQAMQAVLTHRLFAEAEAGEALSLLCDWDLDRIALGTESGAVEELSVGV